MTGENELDELSSGLKEPWLNCRGMDWRRDVGVGMEVGIRFTAGETEGTGVAFGERVTPLGFRVAPLALLSLLSMETLDRPLIFVLRGGDVIDTREVEVLRDTLVDASEGAPFFVFIVARSGRNQDRFRRKPPMRAGNRGRASNLGKSREIKDMTRRERRIQTRWSGKRQKER